jgi:hypothetical protein
MALQTFRPLSFTSSTLRPKPFFVEPNLNCLAARAFPFAIRIARDTLAP